MKRIGTISSMNVMRPIGQMCLVGLIGLVSLITFSCLLVSCGGGAAGEDDLSAPQGMVANEEMVPITFSGNQGTETTVTRADGTPLSETGVDAFKVWGYKNMNYSASIYDSEGTTMQTVFPCYTVSWGANTAYTTTSNTNNWEYVGGDQTIKFWDWAAKAYRFIAATGWDPSTPANPAAYVEGKTYGATGTYGPEGAYKTYKISMFADASDAARIAAAPYFSRLWFSTGEMENYPDKQFGKPVTLEFLKPYARVRFMYIYVYPREGIVLTEQTFKPSDSEEKTYSKGIVTVTYPLTGTDTKEWYSMEEMYATEDDSILINQDYDPENDTKTYYNHCVGGWYTVLPNTSQGSYTLSVKVNNSVPAKTAVVPAEYMQWKPGYSYTYIFKITDKGGVEIGWVDYAVTPWNDVVADHTVYNW